MTGLAGRDQLDDPVTVEPPAPDDEPFRLTFDGAPTPMALTDLTSEPIGLLLRVNRAMCELTGRTEAELLGHSLREFTHPDDLPLTDGLLDVLTTGSATGLEKRYLHADGHEIWAQLSISLVRDRAGRPSYTICHLQDVTARRQDRVALQHRFELLADSVTAGFALHQLDPPELRYANRAYRAIFGLAAEQPAPTLPALCELVHPDQAGEATELLAKARACLGSVTDLRMRLSGGKRWIRITLNPVLADGRPTNELTAVLEDVTEHVQASLALRESEQRFVELADSLTVGVSLRQLDPPRMLYVNPAFVEICGSNPLAAHDPAIDDALSIVHPDDRALVIERYYRRAQVGHFAESEHRIVRPDGQVRWVRVTSNPVTATGRIANRCAGTIEDITERKNAEAAVRSAQAEAERANDAKDEFLSRMSHELRTPLNAVLGFAQLLELDELTDSQRDSVDHILRGGNHLLAMINDVLDIAGIEANHFELAIEPVRLAELIADTVGLMRPLAAAGQLSLDVDQAAGDEQVSVLADRRRLSQVLFNLLSNAIKYTRPAGRVTVAIEAGPDELASVRVSDTGIGIPAEVLPRLFTPFDRLGRQATGLEGAGIGLALSHRLVSVMGGRLTVEPAAGGGSTFRVSLPRPGSGVAAPTAGQRATGWPALPSTVLCIDRASSHDQLVTSVLRRRPNWRHLHASSPAQGVQLAATAGADAILLDLPASEMPAEHLLDELSRASGGAPIAVLGADIGPRQAQQLRAAGAAVALTTPLDIHRLLAFLDEHTRQPPGAPPDSITL